MMNEKDLMNRYREDGYCVLDNVVSLDECAHYLEIAERIAERQPKKYVPIMNLDRIEKTFRNLMCHPQIVSLLEKIQGHQVFGLQSMFYFKPPGSLGRDMHQDNYYAQADYGAYLGTWIPLVDANRENGGLVVYPGSHKLDEILPVIEDESRRQTNEADFKNDRGFSCVVPCSFKKVYLDVPAGSCVLIHGHLIHGSEENMSHDNFRQVFACHYITEGKKYISGSHADRQPVDLHN